MARPIVHKDDLTGRAFGQLTVTSFSHISDSRHRFWICLCSCGTVALVTTGQLLNGRVVSCGCFRRSRMGLATATHRLSGTSEHHAWAGMIKRCRNQKCQDYPRYGGRGITVCERWAKSFEAFLQDMGLKPTRKHTLERKDVNGNYEPGNCCWIPKVAQARNRRNNRHITFNGQTKLLCEWAEVLGLRAPLLSSRLGAGWSVERAFLTPIGPTGRRSSRGQL